MCHVPRSTLAAWFLAPSGADEIRARQAAVRELAPALDARLALAAVAGRRDPAMQEATETLIRWAEEPPRLLGARWLAWEDQLPTRSDLTAWLDDPRCYPTP